jgi:hypothetical protein
MIEIPNSLGTSDVLVGFAKASSILKEFQALRYFQIIGIRKNKGVV